MMTPPIEGPVKLPRLKAIPQSKFPVGNRFFGIISVINAIPSENVEPTTIPADRKQINKPKNDSSKKLAAEKLVNPRNKITINTFQRPKRSLRIPSGSCVIIPPTAKEVRKIDTSETSIPDLRAYTGKIPFKEDSKKPYARGGKKATQPYFRACPNRFPVSLKPPIPSALSGYSFFNAKINIHPTRHMAEERIKGSEGLMLTSGVISGPTANPIPKNNPYKERFLPLIASGEEDVIQVCVAK